jgi:hypothetical protein
MIRLMARTTRSQWSSWFGLTREERWLVAGILGWPCSAWARATSTAASKPPNRWRRPPRWRCPRPEPRNERLYFLPYCQRRTALHQGVRRRRRAGLHGYRPHHQRPRTGHSQGALRHPARGADGAGGAGDGGGAKSGDRPDERAGGGRGERASVQRGVRGPGGAARPFSRHTALQRRRPPVELGGREIRNPAEMAALGQRVRNAFTP